MAPMRLCWHLFNWMVPRLLTSMGKSLQLDGAQETVNIDGNISSTGWCPGDCVNINCKFSSTGWCPGDYVNINGKISSTGCLPEDFVHLTVWKISSTGWLPGDYVHISLKNLSNWMASRRLCSHQFEKSLQLDGSQATMFTSVCKISSTGWLPEDCSHQFEKRLLLDGSKERGDCSHQFVKRLLLDGSQEGWTYYAATHRTAGPAHQQESYSSLILSCSVSSTEVACSFSLGIDWNRRVASIHEDRMWLPQWLDWEMITYTKISLERVNARDRNKEEEEGQETGLSWVHIHIRMSFTG